MGDCFGVVCRRLYEDRRIRVGVALRLLEEISISWANFVVKGQALVSARYFCFSPRHNRKTR